MLDKNKTIYRISDLELSYYFIPQIRRYNEFFLGTFFIVFLLALLLLILLKMQLISIDAEYYCSKYGEQQLKQGKSFEPREVNDCMNQYKSKYVLHF